MRRFIMMLCGMVLVSTSSTSAQTFLECVDVTGDGRVNLADLVTEWSEYVGKATVPTGKGDVDFRQGYNVGDARYLLGFIFYGWEQGGCAPFPAYPLNTSDDTLYLPTANVSAGSGQLVLPILFVTHHKVLDLVLPIEIVGFDGSATIDSISTVPDLYYYDAGYKVASFGSSAVFTWFDLAFGSGSNMKLQHGVHHLGNVHVTYESGTGGYLMVLSGARSEHTFLNYTYSDREYPMFDYDEITIGRPEVVSAETQALFPIMMVDTDTLYFTAQAESENPPAQPFTVSSMGSAFAWSITTPSWISADKTSGMSGETVMVSPNIAGLSEGDYVGDVVLQAAAIGSPLTVTVKLTLLPAAASFDVNCDGTSGLSDIITLVNYMFRHGPPPCNPCTGGSTAP